ncbi:hypothetical protein [Stygiolobus caldivivus]|uniref:Uncharacterized protein n=1 Tax=Stygiolobus caldivivus TaxID=2824673 RepID=A0A8D5U8S8_9CREN|nr:hypothetical protein [Stygiolobus caldivivus]BCU71463.1 hypothetical protein KN1_27600 [Stygiolobus caldivivus]
MKMEFNKREKIIIAYISMFIFLISIVLPPYGLLSQASSSNTNVSIYYERYYSSYQNLNGISILPRTGGSTVTYTTESAMSNLTSNVGGAMQITLNKTVYVLTFSPDVSTIKGYVSIYASPNMRLNIHTNIPDLVRVIVNSSGTSTLVWSGFNASDISTYAYINGSGIVYLEFANGSEISVISQDVKVGHNYTLTYSLMLYTLQSIKVSLSEQVQISVPINLPKRYQPINFSTSINGQMFMANEENISPTLSYFNGTLVASLVWKGEGIGFVQNGMLGHEKADFETVEFYGINGTVLGYVHLISYNGTENRLLTSKGTNVYFGEEKILLVHGVKALESMKSYGTVYINGKNVIVLVGNNGQVSSTAKVDLAHEVSINSSESGVLVYLNLNGSVRVVVVTLNNSTINVSLVKPLGIQPTIVTINGTQYEAQRVVLNHSGNIVFNVSLILNGKVAVYKQVSGSIVSLNSTNYFVINKTLVVYDDPSTVYYIVYYNMSIAPSTTQVSSTTSTAQVTSTTSTQIPSTSQNSALTVFHNANVSNVPITPSSSSEKAPITTPELAIIGIIIVIIVGALLIFTKRK